MTNAAPGRFSAAIAPRSSKDVRAMVPNTPPPSLGISWAVAPEAQLHGGIAVLIRDAKADIPCVIVMAQEHAGGILYVAARTALLQDRTLEPTPGQRRVITLFRDRRLRLETAGHTKWAQFTAGITNVSPAIDTKIQGDIPGAPIVHLEGVGPVKLIWDDRQSWPSRGP